MKIKLSFWITLSLFLDENQDFRVDFIKRVKNWTPNNFQAVKIKQFPRNSWIARGLHRGNSGAESTWQVL